MLPEQSETNKGRDHPSLLPETDQTPPGKEPVCAFETGIHIVLPPESIARLRKPEVNQLKRAATITFLIAENFTEAPESQRIELFTEEPSGALKLPKGIWRRYQQIVPHLKIQRGADGEAFPVMREISKLVPLVIKGSEEGLELDPGQKEVLEAIFERREGGLIHSAMGSGKAMLVCALVFGLPLLRPAAISGKGQKDVLQLRDWLNAFNKKNPDLAEKVILSGCGRSPGKRDSKILESGEGIFLCTHAGLQNLPENIQLLILDEVHAAATPKRVARLFLRPGMRRIYGLSGTLNLRADGGDKLLESLCGPIFTQASHENFEKTKRVAPTEIHVYNFWGSGEYLPNPQNPSEEPEEGYGIQQTWVENHRGRHQFCAELALWLPQQETKVIFTPHILHGARILKAILLQAKQRGIVFEDGCEPFLLHANTGKNARSNKLVLTVEEQNARLKLLKHGLLKLVICTDFVSTGVDTNAIDHVIDASGQKALITNIQRSGRGTRPRINADGSEKINKVHIILDRTQRLLHILGEQKVLALRKYYGHEPGKAPQNRKGGYFFHRQPPWNPNANPQCRGIALPMMASDSQPCPLES
jgi:superfamily II DNA or RNA helicase